MTESDGDDASPVGPTHPGTKPPTRQREAGASVPVTIADVRLLEDVHATLQEWVHDYHFEDESAKEKLRALIDRMKATL